VQVVVTTITSDADDYARKVKAAVDAAGLRAEIDLRQILVKRLKIMGATLRPQSSAAKGRLAQDLLNEVWPLFADRRLTSPPIHARFALAAAAEAHALMEAGTHIGKIVLLVEHTASVV